MHQTLGFLLLVQAAIIFATKSSNFVEQFSVDGCDVGGDDWRFDCFPRGVPNENECLVRGCCWRPAEQPLPTSKSGLPVPQCFFPRNFETYRTVKLKSSGTTTWVYASLVKQSPYPNDVQNIVAKFQFLKESILRICIQDADHKRWEVPQPPVDRPSPSATNEEEKSDPDFDYTVAYPRPGSPFGFRVSRKGGGTLMESVGGFYYSDQLLQFSTPLASTLLYGLGEHRSRLKLDTNWTRLTLWNRDHPPEENVNLYGSHPIYINKDDKGWFAVFLHNSNAMDVILQPAPAITWRTIGGIFDFYIMTGPTLTDVIRQYTSIIGTTFLVPYWSLGFHLCSQYYGTAKNTIATMDRVRKYGIPQDTQWNDIDYAANSRVFTTDYKKFGNQTELAEEIHRRGMHYIIMVDCGISNTAKPGTYPPYDLGMKKGLFIKDSDGQPLVGRVWPGTTVWPDFLNPKTQSYWTEVAKEFHAKVPFDGMWVDMDEISSFVDGSMRGCNTTNKYDNPPYLPDVIGGALYKATICPHAQHEISSQYNVHNLYGMYDTINANGALKSIRQKRPFVISRSTFPGQGHFGGHWSGDNFATWHDLHMSITSMLHMNMYGIPVTGSDICGYNKNTTSELCTRWHQLGAFYVFSRNHNEITCHPQDPGSFGPESAASSRKAYLTRYSLLPYLYTLLVDSHRIGDSVARPLLWEFPDDPVTYDLDTQFLWGSALMISPVLQPVCWKQVKGSMTKRIMRQNTLSWVMALARFFVGQTKKRVYFTNDTWYDFYNGAAIPSGPAWRDVPAPADVIPLHVRGGYIIPMQKPALTTTESRRNPFWLLVALKNSSSSSGKLYFDDGDSLDSYTANQFSLISFTATQSSLTSKVHQYNFPCPSLSNVTVFGVQFTPSSVLVNGAPVHFTFEHTVLYISSIQVDLKQQFKITWSS